MALWLIRCGRHGEHEQKFLDDSRVYLTWEELGRDLSKLDQQADVYDLLMKVYTNASSGKCSNHAGQIWAFSHRMQPGDHVHSDKASNIE